MRGVKKKKNYLFLETLLLFLQPIQFRQETLCLLIGQFALLLDAGLHEFEPEEAEILEQLLPYNLSIQVFRSLLESAASEQGARMTAMDSATRNAGEMIDKLTLNYNRTRQAKITGELIEIISGAEAT